MIPHHLRNTSSTKKKVDWRRRRVLLLSYLPDWVISLGLWLAFYAIDSIPGFRREFSLTDTSIQHTYADHERVPVWLLAIVAGVIPAIIIVLIGGLLMRNFWDVHSGLLGFILAWGLTTTVTDIIKVTVGRPRPDLINRCIPLPGSVNADIFGLSTFHICTQTDQGLLKDGFRSFPSGHSSSAFTGLGFLSLYLAAKLHLFDSKGYAIKAWIVGTPLLGAALIAISRTEDYRHHATDVIAGALLGYLLAWFAYRLYYPPLGHRECHKPYEPRILEIRDDEMGGRVHEETDETVPRQDVGIGMGMRDEHA